jgi:hypothetical protein
MPADARMMSGNGSMAVLHDMMMMAKHCMLRVSRMTYPFSPAARKWPALARWS